jgi:2-keto-3-deoxy-L-rhamnonate aldolase RhmA
LTDLPANPLRAKLEGGQAALGFGVRLARTAEFVSLIASRAYDWLFIDLEHSPMSLETAAELCVTALAAGLAPMARVADGDVAAAARVLDAGAWGVLMSHVEDADEAAAMVRELRFPPAGTRSVSYSLPQLRFAAMRGGETAGHFNQQVLLVAMIESARAVENAAAIAAVPGIDALFMGANDLSADLGVPGDFAHSAVAAAGARIVEACRRHGKWPGIGGIYDEALLRQHAAGGMRLILGGTDMALMLEATAQRFEMLRRATRPPV